MSAVLDFDALTSYSLQKVTGEDAAAMLTSRVTVLALVLVAAFLSGIQLTGEFIECWCPAQLSDAMCNYTKSVCWVSGQYVIDMDEAIPMHAEEKAGATKQQLDFYPLVPFIILLLALLLKIPSFLWSAFQEDGKMSIPQAILKACHPELDEEESVKRLGEHMIHDLRDRPGRGQRLCKRGSWFCLTVKQTLSSLLFFPLGCGMGTYQTGLFLLSRLLALAVVILAYPFLGYCLRTSYTDWGWSTLRSVLDPDLPTSLTVFPRETLCDFKVRHMQNVHSYTVQCVLPINMWSEKFFQALWLWLLVLLALNVYSYQYWVRALLPPRSRRDFVNKHLQLLGGGQADSQRDRETFATHYLTHDAVLLLRVLENAAGTQFTNLLVKHLWDKYLAARPISRSTDANQIF